MLSLSLLSNKAKTSSMWSLPLPSHGSDIILNYMSPLPVIILIFTGNTMQIYLLSLECSDLECKFLPSNLRTQFNSVTFRVLTLLPHLYLTVTLKLHNIASRFRRSQPYFIWRLYPNILPSTPRMQVQSATATISAWFLCRVYGDRQRNGIMWETLVYKHLQTDSDGDGELQMRG